jgi:glutamyl-tRNA reductase
MDRMAAELPDIDLLVSCTGANGLVVDRDVVAAAMSTRADRPLGVVDLALPRDIDPRVAAVPGVHLVDLALIQTEHDGAGAVAGDDVATAEELIEAEVSVLRAEQRAAAVAPTVSALRSQAAEVVEAELLRLSTRLPDLDARDRAEIARTVNRVVDKLLHQPTVRMKELAREPGGTDYADALRALFGLRIDTDVDEPTSLAEAVSGDPDLPPGTAA